MAEPDMARSDTAQPDTGPYIPSRSEQRKVAAACIIGNFMEYFDFAIYGFFAVAIGANFFPSDDPSTELLSSLAVFGVAFLIRPSGACSSA